MHGWPVKQAGLHCPTMPDMGDKTPSSDDPDGVEELFRSLGDLEGFGDSDAFSAAPDKDKPSDAGGRAPESPARKRRQDSGRTDDSAGSGGFGGFGGLGGFGGIPFFGDLLKMLQQAPGGGTRQAREVAQSVANGGESEPNIDPGQRIALEQLVRVAELRVVDATGLEPAGGSPLRVKVANRSQWANRTMSDYAPIIDALASAAASGRSDQGSGSEISLDAMLSSLTQVIGPMMLSVGAGTMVGRLAQRALGGYLLPIPRAASSPLLVNLPNVERFGREWSLDQNDLRLWVCLQEATYHCVFAVPHVRERVTGLLTRHAEAFEPNPRGLDELFGDVDPGAGLEGLAALSAKLENPESLLGMLSSPAQSAIRPELTAIFAAVTGFVDHTMDRIGGELIGSYSRLTEALRRHRLDASTSESFIEQMLGLELDRQQFARGTAFANGVVERSGEAGLQRLFERPGNLPTPNEVDAPGLWLARIELTA